jgi:hypothetical protein
MRWATGLSSAVFVLGLGSILRAPPPTERYPPSFAQYPVQVALASPNLTFGLMRLRNPGPTAALVPPATTSSFGRRERAVTLAATSEPEATARPPPLVI